VNKFVTAGSTVNLCALDVSKAFDKVIHFGLIIKPFRKNDCQFLNIGLKYVHHVFGGGQQFLALYRLKVEYGREACYHLTCVQ
jgi:hypothetical protein